MGKSTREARVETRFILSYPIVRALSPMRIIRRDRARVGINFQHKKVQQHGERSFHAARDRNFEREPLAFSLPGKPRSSRTLALGFRCSWQRRRIDKDREPVGLARGGIINRPARNLGILGKAQKRVSFPCRGRSTNGRTRRE